MSEKRVELVWEAPSETPTGSMYKTVLAEVKKNPGRWARIRVFETGRGYNAASSLRKQTKDDPAWEFKLSQTEQDGTDPLPALYARYRTAEQMKATK